MTTNMENNTNHFFWNSSLFILRTNLDSLSSMTKDFLSLSIVIDQSIKLLKQMAELLRTYNKRNKFGLNLPSMMLCQIFSFLPRNFISQIGYLISKLWRDIFTSSFAQKVL